MKIYETNKGNVKIVMSREQAMSLATLLKELSLVDFRKYERKNNSINSTNLVTIWNELGMFMDVHH